MLSSVILLWLATSLPDQGVFPDLTPTVVLRAPRTVDAARARLRVDAGRGLATLYDGEHPVAIYVGRAAAAGARADHTFAGVTLSTADAASVRRLLGPSPRIESGAPPAAEDQDGDGIVDRMDVLVGAKKLVANGAAYITTYRQLPYPGGDVPRTEGVCTDTIIRALRNAGLDLQRAVHEDIKRARRAYPMVKRPDPNIDHRRVKTLLPWLQRHLHAVPTGEPTRPGDIVLFDTFPSKPGPDHIGIASDARTPGGDLLIINNWTVGYRDAEMDLSAIPVTHRFRVAKPRR